MRILNSSHTYLFSLASSSFTFCHCFFTFVIWILFSEKLFPLFSKTCFIYALALFSSIFSPPFLLYQRGEYTLTRSKVYSTHVRGSLTTLKFISLLPSPWEMHCHHQKGKECESMWLQVLSRWFKLGKFMDNKVASHLSSCLVLMMITLYIKQYL